MDKHLFYIIGIPGSGKSSLVRELIELGGYDTMSQAYEGCPHVIYTRHGESKGMPGVLVQLGVLRTSFPGTDGLAMDILPRALIFMSACPHPVVIAEGDRLATNKFFDGARERGWQVHVVLADVSEDRAALRRVARGSKQNEKWIAGRITKVANLREKAEIILDGDAPYDAKAMAETLRHYMVEQLTGVSV